VATRPDCSEYLCAVAAAQYGKRTDQALEWLQAALVRLSLNEETHVIVGLKRMQATSPAAAKLMENAIVHLTKHSGRLNYASARRGGYHIGKRLIMKNSEYALCRCLFCVSP